MPRIWLPIKEETSGREMILVIPGASRMDRSELAELIAEKAEDIQADLKAQGPKPVARFSREEIKGALREFAAWARARREDRARIVFQVQQ